MDQEQIDRLTSKSILQEEVFLSLFDLEDEIERERTRIALCERAAQLNVKTEFGNLYRLYKKKNDALRAEYERENALFRSVVPLKRTEKGLPALCIENFSAILDNDKRLMDSFLFNEMGGIPEHIVNGEVKRWLDEDDSKLRAYIEKTYGIHHEKKLNDALRIKFSQNRYHPVREMIQGLAWDGVPRIETLLIKWLKAEDNAYTREVSRLIFAGGIHRAFRPGCKFDDMAVLIGQRQGEGKTTFVRWLAMEDRFFREVTEIEGQRGIEAIEGAWVCEMGELLALKRTKDVEAVKSYLTRQCDTYRQPFDKRTTDHPRQCIFIGTTNHMEFLSDKTGNRRYFPIVCNNSGRDLFDNEAAVRADIAMCWAEAYQLYLNGKLPPVANRKLLGLIQEKQSESVEDDYRIGMIEDYLSDRDTACILELWEKALHESFKPSRKDSNEIGLIMQGMKGWHKVKTPRKYGDYGSQRIWIKDAEARLGPDLPF